jgi:hypothetical protein
MLMRSTLPMIFSIARHDGIDGINLLFRQSRLFFKVERAARPGVIAIRAVTQVQQIPAFLR